MSQQPLEPGGPLAAELARWVEAELISKQQAEGIFAFEARRAEARRQGKATRAMALLGGLTLVSGVGSLVAYNWGRFSGTMKLLCLGVLLLASVGWNLRAMKTQRAGASAALKVNTALDVSLLVTTGLTLAGLALVSQVYHQDGELWHLLFAWCALTASLMSYARTRFAHYFWFGGLFVSLVSASEALESYLRERLALSYTQNTFALTLVLGTLTGLLVARFAASQFPGRRAAGLSLLQLLLLVVGLLGGLFWFHGEQAAPALWALGLASIGSLVVATPESVESLGWGSRQRVRGLWALGIGLAVLPMGLQVDSGFLAFVAFLLFWGVAWYFAEKAHGVKNARFAVGVIGIRIVIASFELFESLLLTGSVLVGLGAAALLWSRFKWTPEGEGGAPHD